MQMERLDEKRDRLELAKQRKQADLDLLEDENSDEDYFKYKISAKDFDILQQAKAERVEQRMFAQQQQQQQFGFMDRQPNQQPAQFPMGNKINIIGNIEDAQDDMIVDQLHDDMIRSESNNRLLDFSPPKQNQQRRSSPAKTPKRNTQKRRNAVQGFVDGLKTNKSIK